jgi:hypothetical protein
MGRARKMANLPNAPAFSAYAGATTSISPSGTKVGFNTEEFDTASISITKNGASSKLGTYVSAAQDYIEVYSGHAKGSAVNTSASQSNTWFQAALVRAA